MIVRVACWAENPINKIFEPEAYSRVSVGVVTEGTQWVIEYLHKAFGAMLLRRFDNPDGNIMLA